MSSIGAAIRILNLVKTFGEVRAVDGISLDVSAGEFLTLLGPSGSGKTTTLNLIAGFEIPTSGQILIGDDDIAFKPPHKRNLGMVFQNYALFPHMTVFDNIAFPLKNRRKERGEIQGDRSPGIVACETGGVRKAVSKTTEWWTAAADLSCKLPGLQPSSPLDG